jgi:hypothetical protein
MRKCIAGRCRQGLVDQSFCTCEVGRGRVGHGIGHALHQYVRQTGPCLDGLRIERQRVLEQPNGLRISFTRRRFQESDAAAENVVQRIGMRLTWLKSPRFLRILADHLRSTHA